MFIVLLGAFDTQTIEIGKSTSGKLCIRCQFLSGTSAKGCLIHAKLNGINLPAMPSLIDDMESLSEWACSSNAISHNDTYQITVFDIESDQTTTEVLSINELVDSETFNSLSVVIDDTPTTTTTSTISMATSATTNAIITSTTDAIESTSTQVITSTSITSGTGIHTLIIGCIHVHTCTYIHVHRPIPTTRCLYKYFFQSKKQKKSCFFYFFLWVPATTQASL